MDDNKVEQDLLDVATDLLGRPTLLPVKVTNLDALLYDTNYRFALAIDVLIKYFVVEFLKIMKNLLQGQGERERASECV